MLMQITINAVAVLNSNIVKTIYIKYQAMDRSATVNSDHL